MNQTRDQCLCELFLPPFVHCILMKIRLKFVCSLGAMAWSVSLYLLVSCQMLCMLFIHHNKMYSVLIYNSYYPFDISSLGIIDYIDFALDLGCWFYVGLSNKLFTKLEVYVMCCSLCCGCSIYQKLYVS
jgi:hypothetical protein